MSTTITTLIENNPGEHLALQHEHGLSFLLEHNGTRILFDSGQGRRFLDNARELHLDLRSVDHVVLSHGHYDHTNGLPYLVNEVTGEFKLHLHTDFFDRKYATDGLSHIYLGPSFDREWLSEERIDLERVDGTGYEVGTGIHLVTAFENLHPRETKNPRFIVKRPGDGKMEIDDFRDEVSIVLETEPGLIVLVGCSHPGIMNMSSTIKKRFNRPIHAVLGGTHLVEAQGERLNEALQYLTGDGIDILGPSHCTGSIAMDVLSKESDRFYRNVTGTSLLKRNDSADQNTGILE